MLKSSIETSNYHSISKFIQMTLKDFYRIYPPKRIIRKFFLGLASLPMLPQTRAKFLKFGGVNINGRVLIYGGIGIDTVAPERIHIGNNTTITAGVKILTHYLDPTLAGRHFRLGDVHIGENVFIGVNSIICNSVSIGDGAIIGAGSIVTKDIPPYQVWAGNPAKYIKDRTH